MNGFRTAALTIFFLQQDMVKKYSKSMQNRYSSKGRVNEKMDKDFLNDVYKDFFGSGSKDPVKNAEDALKEAEKCWQICKKGIRPALMR